MKKVITLLSAFLITVSLVACDSSDKMKIGVIQYAEHPALDQSYKGFEKALKDAGYGDDKVTIDYQNAQGEGANCETIASKMVNDANNLIYAIATPAAQAAAAKTSDIPIVLSAVTDPKSSGLVKSNKKPGGNVTGVSDLTPIADQIKLLTQLLPDAKKIAIMYCSSEDNSIFQANIAVKEAEKAGLEYIKATIADSSLIQQVSESLIGKVDAIYIPTDNLLAEGMSTIAMVANENNLPCIVGEEGMAKNGGLATYGIDYFELGYRAGKQAVKILEGKKEPKDMAIEYLPKEECTLLINNAVAKKLNITIPTELLDTAKVVE